MMRKTLTLILLTAAATVCNAQQAYYGKLIQSGWGANPAHDLKGDIFSVDENRIQIIGFTFDGNAPAAVFLLGTDKSYNSVQQAGAIDDPTATVIANPQGTFEGLRAYDNEDIVLTLPEGTVLTNYTYISVWCRNFSVYFGGADIPAGFSYPAPQRIGRFSQLAHQVSSGEVTVIDERTIMIESLTYDGQGPDAFFYVGVSENVEPQNEPYGKIPDENGDLGVISRYSGQDIILTLPPALSVRELKWLSIWCIAFTQNFGHVTFDANLNVPPSLEVAVDRSIMNCEALSNNLQVSWMINGDDIMIELAGNIDRSTDYMAFGLSGRESTFAMIGADVIVADWRPNNSPRAIDYHITAYSQCSTNGGTCPDTAVSNGGTDNANMPEGEISNGITRVRYTRPLATGDTSNDKEYKVDGTPQQIVWSIGPLNTNGDAAKHYVGARISTPKAIDFARPVTNNCPSFVTEEQVEVPDFRPHHLYGEEGTVFTVEIGQAASSQGYLALTGQPSWGIAWYVNGILIPELHLKRGVSYTFQVGGGTDPNQGAKYHPLYFTSDVEGGFQQKQNSTEAIYPGMVAGERVDFAVGDYCEWKLTETAISSAENGNVYQCFEQFQQDLFLECDNNPTQYTEYKWTPDESTPDVVYYQCYTHKSLGWKVHIYDELPTQRVAANDCTKSTSSPPRTSPTDSSTPAANSTPAASSTPADSSMSQVQSGATATTTIISLTILSFAFLLL